MASPFVQYYVGPLLREPKLLGGIQQLSSETAVITTYADTQRKQTLRALLTSLEEPTTTKNSDLKYAIECLVQFEQSQSIPGLPTDATDADAEQLALQRAVANKITVALYAESLDTLMSQCIQLEDEAEWWEEVERSWLNVAWYLLQTLPSRILAFSRIVLRVAREDARRQSTSLSWATLQRPLHNSFQPSILLSSLFPHSSSLATSTFTIHGPTPSGVWQTVTATLSRWLHSVRTVIETPLALARHECQMRRKELREARDRRATALGEVSNMRPRLASEFSAQGAAPGVYNFAASLHGRLSVDAVSTHEHTSVSLRNLLLVGLPSCKAEHQTLLETRQLARPSRLVLVWPKLLLLPPLVLYSVQLVYESRASLFDLALETHDTLKAFVRGWLLEPVKDILDTVRARGDEGVIVRKEGVTADLESLERMTISLAKDQLKYGPEELASLSRQIKLGDITPVLKLYENDIRSPIKSVVTGTLLRTLFIQVQKAKVDIDQALFGIDKLLKSQELTFAFVGVAPAFGIVYLAFVYLSNLWSARSRGRFGGKHKRTITWYIMRRVERLLVMDVRTTDDSVSSLTAGLLLVSIAHLRAYGEKHLPKRSKLKDGFLEDVEDLSNPALSKEQKRLVVDRMWRSWGNILEWGRP